MISAEIIADSLNPNLKRLTTMKVVMPRMILAEFNTHRILSKNSASSRAIPFNKMMDAVLQTPFIPLKWMKEHKGMQGTEYISDTRQIYELQRLWIQSSMDACNRAQSMNNRGLTKQMCNRILEPYMYHTVIVSGTEWSNFFALRAHEAAEIHMQELANKMLEAYNASEPNKLKGGEWHIPYGDNIDLASHKWAFAGFKAGDDMPQIIRVKIATARIAGISYTIVGDDGLEEDYEKLIRRHDKLSTSGHWSPFEHCAMALPEDEFGTRDYTSGNFVGFKQYRKCFKNENQADSRIIMKS